MNNGIEPMLTNSISAVNTDKKSKKNNLVFYFLMAVIYLIYLLTLYIFIFNLSFHKIEVFEFQLNQTVFLIHYNIFYQNKLSQ